MSVAEAQRKISSAEFTEWMAYDRIEPGDPERSDLRNGLICATMVNLQRKKGTKPFSPADFVLKFRPKTPECKPRAEVMLKLKSWLATIGLGGPDTGKRKGKRNG